MYFGGEDGSFRIYPGQAQKKCGAYDARTRPWYVAAGSGPKDLVVIVDTSGSMVEENRMALAIDAAIAVIDGATFDNYIGVIEFNSRAGPLVFDNLVQATAENKQVLKDAIGRLGPGGATNFEDAFQSTFDMLDSSIALGLSSLCKTAILFLTDGVITIGENASTVINQIQNRNTVYEATVFTYSFGSGSDRDTPREIACRTSGVYQHVDDGGDLIGSLAGYYKYYATELGKDTNSRTTWVEPYIFSDGETLGTTCSTAVYDTTTNPPAFLGVVAVDFTLDRFLSLDPEYNGILDVLVDESSYCSTASFTECERQAFRSSVSADSPCVGECDSSMDLTAQLCGPATEYPSLLWANEDNIDLRFHERACCIEADHLEFGSDTEPTCFVEYNEALALGLGLGLGLGIPLLICFSICFCCRRNGCCGGGKKGGSGGGVRVTGKIKVTQVAAQQQQVVASAPPSPAQKLVEAAQVAQLAQVVQSPPGQQVEMVQMVQQPQQVMVQQPQQVMVQQPQYVVQQQQPQPQVMMAQPVQPQYVQQMQQVQQPQVVMGQPVQQVQQPQVVMSQPVFVQDPGVPPAYSP
ncbi:unnamed protein product [Chrysoparadoxa australica]